MATGYNDLDAILEPPQGHFKLGIPALWLLHPVRYCDDFDYPYDLLGDTLAAVTSRKTDGTENTNSCVDETLADLQTNQVLAQTAPEVRGYQARSSAPGCRHGWPAGWARR